MHILVIAQTSYKDFLASCLNDALGSAQVRGQASLEGALAEARRATQINLILLDLELGGFAGIEALRRLRERFSRSRVVIFSSADDRTSIYSALRSGAVGYILKNSNRKVMIAALRLIAEGGKYVPPEILSEPEQPARVPVTARQRDGAAPAPEGL